jgi:hypothetical protein
VSRRRFVATMVAGLGMVAVGLNQTVLAQPADGDNPLMLAVGDRVTLSFTSDDTEPWTVVAVQTAFAGELEQKITLRSDMKPSTTMQFTVYPQGAR